MSYEDKVGIIDLLRGIWKETSTHHRHLDLRQHPTAVWQMALHPSQQPAWELCLETGTNMWYTKPDWHQYLAVKQNTHQEQITLWYRLHSLYSYNMGHLWTIFNSKTCIALQYFLKQRVWFFIANIKIHSISTAYSEICRSAECHVQGFSFIVLIAKEVKIGLSLRITPLTKALNKKKFSPDECNLPQTPSIKLCNVVIIRLWTDSLHIHLCWFLPALKSSSATCKSRSICM